MTTMTASEARSNLYRLIDEANSTHTPILITGKRSNAVLIAEEDWRAIQETVYLLSIPGMRESIREGLNTPIGECAKALDW
ncbi:MAG: type II toxin-antitoxin system Phd/YefM family antitoxin [Gammaproteobacteria bacterium]|nr:type II toxin-antitoxin system Phd/YefM family antitoxin [Gammaproteobacteria bacterium]